MNNVTRQTMYVQRSTETRSLNNCNRAKGTNITYSKCVSVA